jgi:hypothetical protein
MKDLVHLGIWGEAMRKLGAGREFGGAARVGGAGGQIWLKFFHRYHFLSASTDKHEISEISMKFC